MSAVAQAIDLTPIIDRQKVGAFHVKLIVIAFLVVMADGYDIGAIAFAAPHLIAAWHVPPKALGLVLSASNIGVLFGSQIFGWVGDNYGRKTALIATNLLFGVFTFAAAYATDLTQLSWLRFFAGLDFEEAAQVLGVSSRTLKRDWDATKRWLNRELEQDDSVGDG